MLLITFNHYYYYQLCSFITLQLLFFNQVCLKKPVSGGSRVSGRKRKRKEEEEEEEEEEEDDDDDDDGDMQLSPHCE